MLFSFSAHWFSNNFTQCIYSFSWFLWRHRVSRFLNRAWKRLTGNHLLLSGSDHPWDRRKETGRGRKKRKKQKDMLPYFVPVKAELKGLIRRFETRENPTPNFVHRLLYEFLELSPGDSSVYARSQATTSTRHFLHFCPSFPTEKVEGVWIQGSI